MSVFEHGNPSDGRILRTQRGERLSHGRGLMRKVTMTVPRFTHRALPRGVRTLLKTRERVRDCFAVCSPCIGSDDHGQAVSDIELTDYRRLILGPRCSLAENLEVRHPVGVTNVARLPLRIFTGPKRFQSDEERLTKRRDDIPHMRAVPAGNQSSVGGHEIHQPPERELHRIEIFVNVRMIEFDIVDHRDFRQVA